jgi:D-beta-D-heptose 7-phosphate kinase/D-beta-D-heptose 1-phosphate adenosyltransferase
MRPVAGFGDVIRRFLDGARSIRILVAGDVMLDTYVSGNASRISPEAPVPVVSVFRRRYIPGGAANVAANIRALGSSVALAGATGVDDPAVRLRGELDRAGINMDALIEDAARPTTVKTRVTAAGQQIVRFDEEDRSPLPASASEQLQHRCDELLSSVDACVISDYAKGVMSEAFCRWLIDAAAKRGKPVVVDPKSRDLMRYRGATVVTPNLRETEAAAREPIHNTGELVRAAGLLLPGIAPSALLITRGEDGMSLFDPAREPWHLPALVNEVSDVTGAGDTVAATLAIGLGVGLSLRDAVTVANLAAGVAVSHHGTWAVGGEELLEASLRMDLAMEAAQP